MGRRRLDAKYHAAHVFLFRHCVRSTESTYHLYSNESDNAMDDEHTTLIAPDWRTPPYWCTEAGMSQMETTGEHILQDILEKSLQSSSQDNSSSKLIQVRILVDSNAQRDVDSALALIRGMQTVATRFRNDANKNGTSGMAVSGLGGSIELAPRIFNPLDAKVYSETSTTSLCNDSSLSEMTDEQIQAEVQHQLDAIPTPTLLSLQSAVQLLINAGIVASISTKMLLPTVTVRNRQAKLSGPINFVKLGAQMLFYSRASNLVFGLANETVSPSRVSMDDMYALLQWHYWMRSVLNVATLRAAVQGAALARAMQDALLSMENRTMDDDESEVETVTLFVGHDGDLDSVATAFGVTWGLGHPYMAVPEWYPTPPGSALRLTRYKLSGATDVAQDHVHLSFLYPVFALNENASVQLRQTSLTLTPLSFVSTTANTPPPTMRAKSVRDATVVAWSDWQARVAFVLQQYPGATECYNAAGEAMVPKLEKNIKSASAAASSPLCLRTWIALSCVNVCLLVIFLRQWLLRRRQRRDDSHALARTTTLPQSQKYDVVSSATCPSDLT
jgi:hypothetical protein